MFQPLESVFSVILMIFLLVRRTGLPPLMKSVFFTQAPTLAKACGADAEYAGVATAISTVTSLAMIPLYMAIVGRVF